ncbi:MAG TPA: hypothetical protein VK177_12305 [Flavobacteriales bacterium]|nr:hypothetical protein [Flavobacteriales bacterium]
MKIIFACIAFVLSYTHVCSQDISLKESRELYELGKKSVESGDYINAYRYAINAVKGKYPDAYYLLGYCYEYGLGTEKNEKESFNCYLASANSKEGKFAGAQYMIAKYYFLGFGCEKNENLSWEWILKSSENGEGAADFFMAQAYFSGTSYAQKNLDLAIKCCLRGAERGHDESQHNMGVLYQDGVYMRRNMDESIKWFTKAAEQNYVLSQYALGLIFADGVYVDQDLPMAFTWFERAAERGHADSQYKLGIIYMMGYSTTPDNEKAQAWLTKAAQQGHEKAADVLNSLEKERVTKLDTAQFHGLKKKLEKKDIEHIKKNLRFQFDLSVDVMATLGYEDLMDPTKLTPEVIPSKTTLEKYKKEAAKNPGDYVAWINLGSEYISLHDRNEGFKALDNCITILQKKILENDVDSLRQYLGIALTKREKFLEALEQFNVCLDHQPNNQELLFLKLIVYMSMGDIEKMTEMANELMFDDPNDANGYIIEGMVKMFKTFGGGASKEEVLNKPVDELMQQQKILAAIERNPDNIDLKIVYHALNHIGVLYSLILQDFYIDSVKIRPQDIENVTKLENFYLEALTNPKVKSYFVIHKLMTTLYFMKRDYLKAIEHGYKAIEIKNKEIMSDNSNADIIYENIAGIYLLLKDTLKSEQIIVDKIAQINNPLRAAKDYVSVARFQVHRGDLKGAEKNLKKAIEINPAEPSAWMGFTVVAILNNNLAKATAELAKAPTPNDNEAKRKFLEGVIAMLGNDYKSAYKSFKNALIIDREFSDAQLYLDTYFN